MRTHAAASMGPIHYSILQAQMIVDFAIQLHPELAIMITRSQVLAALGIRKEGDEYLWIPN